MIMLCWLWIIWILLFGYDYFSARVTSKNSVPDSTVKTDQAVEEKEIVSPKEPTETSQTKRERKIVEESWAKKQDKAILKRYRETLKEYKKTLSAEDYKKFEAMTRYDTLLYDALMVSRDKEWELLSKLENEKWSLYASAITKILG